MTAGRERHGVEIDYQAPPGVRAVIESIGRTEDIRFSPDGRRVAIAAFEQDRLAVLDVDLEASTPGTPVVLSRVVKVSSPYLKRPHGLDFIDDQTLIVANREGGVCVFTVPSVGADVHECVLSPVQVMDVGPRHGLHSPGSLCIAGENQAGKEILIGSNFRHRVTRHVLDRVTHTLTDSEVLLRKWLDVPDGVSVSKDRRWAAISNHNTHNVLMYEYTASLGRDADPDGILRGLHYPHGLRFSPDDRYLFVADAAAPYVHVYARDELGWGGVRHPVSSFRVLDDAQFQRGRTHPEEGGPKGIDLHMGINVLAMTAQGQPLAFFDLSAILEDAALGSFMAGSDTPATDGPPGSDGRLDRRLVRVYRPRTAGVAGPLRAGSHGPDEPGASAGDQGKRRPVRRAEQPVVAHHRTAAPGLAASAAGRVGQLNASFLEGSSGIACRTWTMKRRLC